MALFSLTDIGFKTDTRVGTDKLVRSQYASNLFKYPSDLGAADKGHYLVININEQMSTSFDNEQLDNPNILDTPTAIANRTNLNSVFGASSTAATIASGINDIKGIASYISNSAAGDVASKVVDSVFGKGAGAALSGNIQNEFNNLTAKINADVGIRTVRRIKDTVALYMPDTLAFSHNQNYEQLAPGQTLPQAILSGISSVSNSVQSGGGGAEMFKAISPFLANHFLNKVGDVGKILFTAGSGGRVNNPMMEILYSSPEFRSFRFDFMMYPRDEKEALEVQNIINLLRFHQAPELVKGSGGFFMYPPSEFDISFYYNGSENPNIPRISTCVLTNIDVDYAPQGFHAYEVPGENTASLGRTGMPVATRLSLQFKETEYIVKGSPLLGVNSASAGANETSQQLRDAGQVNAKGEGIY